MPSETTGAFGLAGRYATALFELAGTEGALDAVADELRRLGDMIQGSGDLQRLVRSPVISREDQRRAMAALVERAGMGELIGRFIGVVADNRRLFALPAMIEAYLDLLARHRGETTAEVVSARALTGRQIEALGASLKKAVGGKVAVHARVDPELLGGLVVKVGSRMVDSSLASKLQRLGLAMKGTG